MTWFSGILVYIIIWWVVIFTVLPWGAKPPANPERGHATSAPARPMLGRKVLATTAISAVLWIAIYLMIDFEVFSFRPDRG